MAPGNRKNDKFLRIVLSRGNRIANIEYWCGASWRAFEIGEEFILKAKF